MKKFTFSVLVLLFILAPVFSFAQDTAPAAKPDGSDHPLADLFDRWHAEDQERALKRLGEYRADTEKELLKYNRLLEKRSQAVLRLERALVDGDETLLEVALDVIRGNKSELATSAKWLVEEHGKKLLSQAVSVYTDRKDEDGEEARYTEHLAFYRKAKALTEQVPPAELTKLLADAQKAFPRYFERLEEWGMKF